MPVKAVETTSKIPLEIQPYPDQDRSADLLEMSHATMNNIGNRLLVGL